MMENGDGRSDDEPDEMKERELDHCGNGD